MNIDITIGVLIGIIVALNEGLKIAFGEAIKKYIPFIAIILGIGFSYGFFYGGNVFEILVTGLIMGLSAVGLYEEGKSIKKVIKK